MPYKGTINNPSGKGGFSDNPQNRSNGTWSKDTSISYWYNNLIRLDIEAFRAFEPQTMAQELAYAAVLEAKEELSYLKEVTDRTEGKASQSIDVTSDGNELKQTVIKWGDNEVKV
jgi:predicted component of type VI protein secretion system